MNKFDKYVVGPVLAGSIIVTGYATNKMKTVERENVKLKNEMLNKMDKPIVYNVTVEDIREINKNNADLIVYESGFSEYKLEIEDNTFLGINSTIKAKFKYLVTIDMTKAKISTTNDIIIVNVSAEDIHLKEVVIKQPNFNYDTNIITQMRGKKIINTETSMITKLYEGIDKEVEQDCIKNSDNFKINLMNKSNKLYDADHVKVIIN